MSAGSISLQARRPGLDTTLWVAAAALLTLFTAYLVLVSAQLAGTVAVVVLVTGLYVRSPAAGMSALWACWLVLPEVRRLFGYVDGYVSADPLAIAPFLATACVALVELSRGELSRRARWLLGLGSLGFAVGFPLGLLVSPPGAVYALFAYTAGLSAFVLGYAERGRLTEVSLYRVLLVALPPLALYGLLQYFALPIWDAAWLEDTGFVTAGAPEAGRVRVFSTLNAPGVFAPLLGVGIILFLSSRRVGPAQLFALGTAALALALTYVRSSWVALAAGLLALALASHGRGLARVGVVIALIVMAVPALAAGGGTAGAVVGRFDTLGQLETDTSANARITTQTRLVPRLVTEPLGAGLGTAGEATRLGGGSASGLRAPDSAYLSMLIQLGPFGALLVLGALFSGMASAFRNAARRASWTDAALVALLVFYLVHMVGTDLLYGIPGVILWFLIGFAVRREDDHRAADG